jgi:hypothetical protein
VSTHKDVADWYAFGEPTTNQIAMTAAMAIGRLKSTRCRAKVFL